MTRHVKRYTAALLAVVLAASLAACQKRPPDNKTVHQGAVVVTR